VRECIERGLVGGNIVVSDGSFIPANVSWKSRTEALRTVEKSAVDYLETLERELRDTNGSIRINASSFYPSSYENRRMHETPAYQEVKRLRSIWSEGTFGELKNNHNLKRHRKGGIYRVAEECILSAMALNLKRMIKIIKT
jgi:hypothetical protein